MDENHSACVPHQFRGYGLRHTWLFSHAWLYHYICRQSSWNRNFSSVCTAIISVPDMQISYSCCFPWAIPSDVVQLCSELLHSRVIVMAQTSAKLLFSETLKRINKILWKGIYPPYLQAIFCCFVFHNSILFYLFTFFR